MKKRFYLPARAGTRVWSLFRLGLRLALNCLAKLSKIAITPRAVHRHLRNIFVDSDGLHEGAFDAQHDVVVVLAEGRCGWSCLLTLKTAATRAEEVGCLELCAAFTGRSVLQHGLRRFFTSHSHKGCCILSVRTGVQTQRVPKSVLLEAEFLGLGELLGSREQTSRSRIASEFLETVSVSARCTGLAAAIGPPATKLRLEDGVCSSQFSIPVCELAVSIVAFSAEEVIAELGLLQVRSLLKLLL
mmetsp:Transcript_3173/g.7344  ORF Transcript_3173/g.7344 Transcript_3173/m.7344 type:complete len:244 (+) Transcript_3173:95-826(+)